MHADVETARRAMRLREMTREMLVNMTPPERDRMMQVHMAQARGPVGNGDLLRQSTDALLMMRAGEDDNNRTTVVANALIDLLTETVRVLDEVQVPYAIAGSVASSVHGEVFASLNVDLIVQASPEQAQAVARKLSPRFYAPEDMLAEAARGHSMANVADNRTGLKVDLSFVPATGFLATVMARRTGMQIGSDGPEFQLVTAEDVILTKLLWRKETRSQKQWENALSVARVKGARMDWNYLWEQADSLRIKDDLVKLRDEAGI